MFWDSSGLLPLLVQEEFSSPARALLRDQGVPIVWWGSVIECRSALERRAREGGLTQRGKLQAVRLLDSLAGTWSEVLPTPALRVRAVRLLAVHSLRTADATQLAAALVWAEDDPASRGFVCLDSRLRDCALREGFQVLPEVEP